MTSGRLIAIGDIHGCVHALEAVLEAVKPQPQDHLIILGDFIDQGLESAAVIDRLIQLRDECELTCLMGNHEEMFLSALTSDALREYWEIVGGHAMLNSYRFGASLKDIPTAHIEFVRDCKNYYETEDHIFVHANLDPDRELNKQSTRTIRWALLDESSAIPHMSGKTVIVGHTEQTKGEILDFGFIKCIDTACWRYGWLTALEIDSGKIWQASRFGQMRQRGEVQIGPTSEPHR